MAVTIEDPNGANIFSKNYRSRHVPFNGEIDFRHAPLGSYRIGAQVGGHSGRQLSRAEYNNGIQGNGFGAGRFVQAGKKQLLARRALFLWFTGRQCGSEVFSIGLVTILGFRRTIPTNTDEQRRG